VDEPYRLFTSRAEFRLLLRQDNALRRLLPVADAYGLLTIEELGLAYSSLSRQDAVRETAEDLNLKPAEVNDTLLSAGTSPIDSSQSVASLVKRPGVSLTDLLAIVNVSADEDSVAWAEIEIKYDGYIVREKEAADRILKMEDFSLPSDLPFHTFNSVSFEAREKLGKIRPATLGQASRIPGLSPSDLQGLLMEVVRLRF
jgi:tRNA uridine 5-carboxymethylaminomethyl modification enzyme